MDFLNHMTGAIAPFLHQYGYAAVFVVLFLESFGVPLPGESLLVSAVFLASRGELNIMPLVAVAFVAAVMGDNFGYLIGRLGGHALIAKVGGRFGLTPERFAKVEGFFARYGGGIVLFARFINVLRQLNGVVAGIMEMPWWRFFAYNAIGGALWVGVWSAGTYYLGKRVHFLFPVIHQYRVPIAIVSLLVAVAVAAWYLTRRARHP